MTDTDYDPQFDDPRPDNPIARPTTYTITCLPETDPGYSTFALTVEYRGRDRWAVLHHRFALGTDGDWDYESSPGNREDDWLDQHRFTFAEAMDRAKAAAPHVSVNGLTPSTLAAWRSQREAA